MVETQHMGGYNMIKIAKYINIIVGVALTADVIFEVISLGFINLP